MWSYNHSDELYHFGVKGMKWGVRKKRDDGSPSMSWKQKRAQKKEAKINKYQNYYMKKQGMSSEDARKAATKHHKSETAARVAAVTAATVVIGANVARIATKSYNSIKNKKVSQIDASSFDTFKFDTFKPETITIEEFSVTPWK